MAVTTLEPQIISNVEGPFNAIWKLVGEESGLLNFGTAGQSEPVLPGEELITNGTSQSIFNPAWEFKADESLIIRHETPIKYVKELCQLTDQIGGDTDFLYFIKTWRWSIDNKRWSKWFSFDAVIEEWFWLNDLYVEFKYICLEKTEDIPDDVILPKDGPTLLLFFVNLNGSLEMERTNQKVVLSEPGQCAILSPDDKWKVFNLIDFELIAGGLTEDRMVDMRFRGSTTSGRQWTQWVPLTTANLQAVVLDPLRFWFLEIQFCRIGTDPTGEIKIWDVYFTGDMQNVTANYSKMGKMGLRSDCLNDYNGEDESCDPNSAPAYPPPEFEEYMRCDSRFQDNKWDPYDLKATELYKKLTEDVNQMFGWDVVYYKTDPDQRGRDVVLHEYSLSHVIREESIKIMVKDNQFPDRKIMFNPFDLLMFDTFEINITRDEFKRAFGIEERPRKWDMLFLCETNMLYQVEHALAHKDFLNSSVYYDVTLRKAQNNQNILPTEEIQASIDNLTENNSLDALFETEIAQETKNISDKKQLNVLTRDETRQNVNAFVRIADEPIENGPNVISKNYYDLSNVTQDDIAVEYIQADTKITKGENRSFIFWFNLKTKRAGENYNLLTNQAVINNQPYGYKITYLDNRIDVEWNGQFLEWMVPELQTNHWYALVMLMDQTQGTWQYFIYRRQSDINPRSYNDPKLRMIKTDTGILEPVEWNITTDMVIHGSEMKMTNIRVFSELIDVPNIQMVLSQYIIRESGKLIFADNANKQMQLPAIEYRSEEARNI